MILAFYPNLKVASVCSTCDKAGVIQSMIAVKLCPSNEYFNSFVRGEFLKVTKEFLFAAFAEITYVK